MARRRGPPSQGWKTFLRNHADDIAAMDLFVVPTVSFRLLYGLLIMSHSRRQIMCLGVTAHPTAEWIANQLTEACRWEYTPGYLIRDRDACYGKVFIHRLRALGIRDHPTLRRSPWQNGHAERLIGSIRRECLDHIIVFGERHLRHVLSCYTDYYNAARTHLSLAKGHAGATCRSVSRTHTRAPGSRRPAPSIRAGLISGRDSLRPPPRTLSNLRISRFAQKAPNWRAVPSVQWSLQRPISAWWRFRPSCLWP